MAPTDSAALATFRSELRKLKGPMTFGLSPLIESIERIIVEQSREIRRVDERCRLLEAEACAQADGLANLARALDAQSERIAGLSAPGESIQGDLIDGCLPLPPGREIELPEGFEHV